MTLRTSLWLALSLLAASASAGPVRAQTSAFFYGPDIPPELLTAYDQVVVEPSQIRSVEALSKQHAALVAYLSIGEVTGANVSRIDSTWVIGQNAAWSSRVMDLSHPGYRAFLLREYEALWQSGYRRFFLDTLDSYELAKTQPTERAQQRAALAELIRALAAAHPDAKILLNRGFQVLPEVATVVHGVVAESLFDGFRAADNSYVRVPDKDRNWLLARLREVKQRYHLPITVIDYRPEGEREQARDTARRIAALGFHPWVCNGSLTNVGVGAFQIWPRRVLIVSDQEHADARPGTARWLAPVLEYLGYLPEYHHVSEVLPTGPLRGRYAGVITSLQTADAGARYAAWLLAQIHAGVPVAIFGALGFAADSSLAAELGLATVTPPSPGASPPKATVFSTRDDLIGFECEPTLQRFEGAPVLLQHDAVQRHLELRFSNDAVATAIATTSWGGLALSHVFALRGLHGERFWVLDPFQFLTSALRLPVIPVPDVTTESGGRVALFAIDAQGAGDFARLRGRPHVSEVLAQRLGGQAWPHALGSDHELTNADRAALSQLLEHESSYADHIRPGGSAPFGVHRSLTLLEPLYVASQSDPIAAPIASDVSYLEGSSEAYPMQRVLEAYDYTDAPRRLRPIALHYHAYATSAPGGLEALDTIYAALARQRLFVVRVPDYLARIHGFRDQVVAQDVNGGFVALGGEALRTWRLPDASGALDFDQSSGVATLASLAQGRYLTFSAHGPRRVQFSQRARTRPHLEQTNGRVDQFRVLSQQRGRVRIELGALAQEPLLFHFAGLPKQASCELTYREGTLQLRSDAQGRSFVTLPDTATGAAALSCDGARAAP